MLSKSCVCVYVCMCVCAAGAGIAFAADSDTMLSRGNKLYRGKKYGQALAAYNEARAKAPDAALVRDDHPKRRYPRFNVQIGAFCRLGEGRKQQRTRAIAGMIRNLSEGGLMLAFPLTCAKGVLLEVSFRTDESRLRAMSEVVWSGPPEFLSAAGQVCCHGLRFVGTSQQQQTAIRCFLLKRFTI